MRSSRWIRITLCLAVALTVGAGVGQDDPVPRSTGTVEALFDGAPRTFHAYAIDIPEDVAEGVTDAALRERLLRAAGTTEHTATWSVLEPIVMNGVVLFAPKALSVEVATRPTEDRDAGLGELRMSFGLDLASLALADPADAAVSVRYYPERFSVWGYFQLTEGELLIDRVEQVDARTLRIQGSFDGVFTFQAAPGAASQALPDPIVGSGRFDLGHVGGAQPLADVLPAD